MSVGTRSGRKPNILVVLSDEHKASVAGCYGDAVVETPNLDALASRGVVFDSAYCSSPLCVPSRLSMTAGKYASRVSAWNNDFRLPAETITFPDLLSAAGYEAVLCGKQHYDRDHRYGFRELPPQDQNQLETRGRLLGRRQPDDTSINRERWDHRASQFVTGIHSEVLDHDRRVSHEAARFLKDRKRSDRPFFLLAGYLAPHFPLTVPEPYWLKYRGRVPAPNVWPQDADALPLNYRHLLRAFGLVDLEPGQVSRGREFYYALTTWLDDQIGTVLDALNVSEVADDTIVVYTSDHGENLGEHGLWWKNCMFESAVRVPMIVHDPRLNSHGARRTKSCSLLDLVRTFLDWAGAVAPDDWDGHSMVGYLADARSEWKDCAVSEYYGHNVCSGFAMYREGDFKYVYHCSLGEDPAERELYDLCVDPDERHNLVGEPDRQSLVNDLHAKLVAEVGEDPDVSERRFRRETLVGYQGAVTG